jgi:hypothetical protein
VAEAWPTRAFSHEMPADEAASLMDDLPELAAVEEDGAAN